ncbi:MAG: hypothetical protein JW927_20850 [Deltaproteobacteria bacterium]|nr:hypothetical protein [Deltaproteobacteria bacterium]
MSQPSNKKNTPFGVFWQNNGENIITCDWYRMKLIMAESGYGKPINAGLKTPKFGKEQNRAYARLEKRFLWMDKKRCPKHLQ